MIQTFTACRLPASQHIYDPARAVHLPAQPAQLCLLSTSHRDMEQRLDVMLLFACELLKRAYVERLT